MNNTLDMQDIRHLNLFSQITKINTRFCIHYNGTLIFCVPKSLVKKSLGENGKNIKKMSEILNKRIRVIPIPRGNGDIKFFIEDIIKPLTFKSIEVKKDEVIINSSNIQNKATLMGREKKRLFELQKAVKEYFNKELKIL
jgi:transcription antitermination factor NusA-like protein